MGMCYSWAYPQCSPQPHWPLSLWWMIYVILRHKTTDIHHSQVYFHQIFLGTHLSTNAKEGWTVGELSTYLDQCLFVHNTQHKSHYNTHSTCMHSIKFVLFISNQCTLSIYIFADELAVWLQRRGQGDKGGNKYISMFSDTPLII